MLYALFAWIAVASPLDEATRLLRRGECEAAAVVLDPVVGDPAAARVRFQVAATCGDDRSLLWSLDAASVPDLPSPIRSRAHLVLGRAALERGATELAREHLEQVVVDTDGWAEARLLLGDLDAADGRPKSAVSAWRDVVQVAPGQAGEALLRTARIYYDLERMDQATVYAFRVDPGSRAWADSRLLLARAEHARGDAQAALGALFELERPSRAGRTWTPEADLIAAAAYESLCHQEEASRLRLAAQARNEAVGLEVDRWLEESLPAAELWEAVVARGALPVGWYGAFFQQAGVAVGLRRLDRIDRELDGRAEDDPLRAGLLGRRDQTLTELGEALARALQEARVRLAQRVVPPASPAFEPTATRMCLRPQPRDIWRTREEFWSDEQSLRVLVPDRCGP